MYSVHYYGTHSHYKTFDIKTNKQFVERLFYGSCKHGRQFVNKAQDIIESTYGYWQDDDGIHILLHDLKINFERSGKVR